MTKQEFYLRSILAMASNPKYVEMLRGEDEEFEEPTPSINAVQIIDDAEYLLEKTEKAWPEAFDNHNVNASLSTIAEAVKGIDDIGIKAFCEIEEV